MFASFKKWGNLTKHQGITCNELASHAGKGVGEWG